MGPRDLENNNVTIVRRDILEKNVVKLNDLTNVIIQQLDTMQKDMYKKALGDINIVVDANIGHVEPKFTVLNGSLATVSFNNNMMILKQELLDENNG